jgi:hypothetical protein
MIVIEPARLPAPPTTPPAPASRNHGRSRVVASGAVTIWLLVVVAGRSWALRLMDEGVKIVLFTPPVLGGIRHAIPWTIAGPITFAVLVIVVVPNIVERLRWRWIVASSTLAALGWWITLALVDGVGGLTRGLYWTPDYADAVSRAAASPSDFLHSYVPTLATQPIALRGHPPGFVLLFGLMDRVGLRGACWATAVVLLVGASAVSAVLITVRDIAGEATARRAAPFVILAPAAIWIATSTDALTMGTAAWVLALLVLAASRHDRVGDVCAAGAGLLAAFTVLQSYGLVLLAIPVIVVAFARHRVRPVVIAGVVALGAIATLALAGYWWLDGLFATTAQYHSLDLDRPYGPFLVINLAAWALAIGPATAAGLAITRDRRLMVIVGGSAVAALAAGLSGLSNGEVERIWLPFTIWVVPAGAALWTSRRATRGWLALQAGSAVLITALIATNW